MATSALHLPPLAPGAPAASSNDAPLSLPTPPRRLANTSRRSTAALPLLAVMAPDGSASTTRRRSQWGAPTATAAASSAPPARAMPPQARRLRSTVSLPAIPAVVAPATTHPPEPVLAPASTSATAAPAPSAADSHVARLAAAAQIARLADAHNLPHVSAALATDVPDLASSRANHARLARAIADGRFADAVRLVEAAAPATETRVVVDLLRTMQWRELRDAGREDAARAVADTVHDRERIRTGELPKIEEVWRAVRAYVAGGGGGGEVEGWVPLLARWFWHFDDVSGEVVDRWSGAGAMGAMGLPRTDSGTVAVDQTPARESNGKVDDAPTIPSWTASPASSAASSRQSSGGKLGSEPASSWLTDSSSASDEVAAAPARSAAVDPLTFPVPDPTTLPPVEPLASWTAGQPPTLSWIDQHGPFHAPVRFFDVTEHDGSDIAALILDSSVLCTTSTTSTHAPAAADRRIYLWDLTHHRLLPHLALPSTKPVSYLSFLPADAGLGAYLVAADLDFAVHAWHWPTGARTTFKKWHRRIIHQVSYVPLRAPLHLVSCSGDHSMRVWAPDGDARGAASVHANQPFLSVCFVGNSADSQILVAAQAYALRLYKSRTLTHLHTFHVADLKMHRTPIHHLSSYPTARATAHTRWTHPDGTPFGPAPPNWVILAAGPTILIFDVDLGAVRAHLASRDLDRRTEAARVAAEGMGGSAALAGVLQPPIRPRVSPCGTFVYVAGGAAGIGEAVVWRCVSGKWERVRRRAGEGDARVVAVPHVAWVRNDRVYACGVAEKSVVVAWAVG
ncbi:hypothetical protein AMAG_10702 [Allomyces macrogynus ATCC 38327]|uniref:Uncharacterized protein n=1 Tax=Allomyces macrogynus (strain ATCC 38327) TaxID=578462 RepID=A0A0L0SRA8_ALLM3|nr:hypothetical protein AMAG_10702 [Allomyces macrogynus ATCC 38327]|eukprot:KNE65036.1 hypothetical protein AMAG_10702 [Allomyces macrogynus ATCC 38327]